MATTPYAHANLVFGTQPLVYEPGCRIHNHGGCLTAGKWISNTLVKYHSSRGKRGDNRMGVIRQMFRVIDELAEGRVTPPRCAGFAILKSFILAALCYDICMVPRLGRRCSLALSG